MWIAHLEFKINMIRIVKMFALLHIYTSVISYYIQTNYIFMFCESTRAYIPFNLRISRKLYKMCLGSLLSKIPPGPFPVNNK